MSTNMGIRRGGLNLNACNFIYWTIVVPTLLFGCEVRVIKKNDCKLLEAFQRYAARRLQRFPISSFNITSFVCMGWMSIINFIKARKAIFVRTILTMDISIPIKQVFLERLNEFNGEDRNPRDSPIIQILRFCEELGILNDVRRMANGYSFSKASWKKIVWKKAWESEHRDWYDHMASNEKLDLVKMVMPTSGGW